MVLNANIKAFRLVFKYEVVTKENCLLLICQFILINKTEGSGSLTEGFIKFIELFQPKKCAITSNFEN